MEGIKKRPVVHSASQSGIFLIRRRFEDLDQFADVARAWDLDFLQLGPGPFCGELGQWGLGPVQLGRARLGARIHQKGSTPAGYRTFAIPTIPDIRLIWRSHEIHRDEIMVFPRGGELDSASHPDFDMLTVSVTEDYLDSAAERMKFPTFDRCLAQREVVSCDAELLSRARRWLLHALEGAPGNRNVVTPERTAELLVQLVSSRTTTSAPSTSIEPARIGARSQRSSDRAIRVALDSIGTAAYTPTTVGDLARVARCSERTLRRAFRSRFGVGPKTYLLSQRLAGVRRELWLSDPGTTLVVSVANRWGFWHMGQFAADFRRFFGELPSTTMRR